MSHDSTFKKELTLKRTETLNHRRSFPIPIFRLVRCFTLSFYYTGYAQGTK